MSVGVNSSRWRSWLQWSLTTGSGAAIWWFSELAWLSACAILAASFLLVMDIQEQTRRNKLIRTLASGASAYSEGSFSHKVYWKHKDDMTMLVDAHNSLGESLRSRHTALAHRELILDAVVQNSPIATVISTDNGQICFSNQQANDLFFAGRSLEGMSWAGAADVMDPHLRKVWNHREDAIVGTVAGDGSNSTNYYSVAQSHFRAARRDFHLLLVKHMTSEVTSQELASWKRAIRSICHELRNSLAPLESLSSSAQQLIEQGKSDQVVDVLVLIRQQCQNLSRFVESYAGYARMPKPRKTATSWAELLAAVRRSVSQSIQLDLPEALRVETVFLDQGQIEQVLVNLVQNSLDAKSAPQDVRLGVSADPESWTLTVADRGVGTKDASPRDMMRPFFSTKDDGTGLGLAICEEIVSAHGGTLSLASRSGGGLEVSIVFPR